MSRKTSSINGAGVRRGAVRPCSRPLQLLEFQLDLGAGVDVSVSERGFIRVDVSDRVLRYEGPVLDLRFTRWDAAFWRHGLRLAAGGGIRF